MLEHRECIICGKTYVVLPSEKERKYCSLECSHRGYSKNMQEKREEKKRVRKRGKKNMLSIEQIAKAAAAEHMTYGEYVNKYKL